MIEWSHHFQIPRPVPGLPRLYMMGRERRSNESYHWRGANRTDNHYCLQVTLSGEGVFERDGVAWPLPAGVAFFCNVTDPAIAYYYPRGGSEPWEFFFLAIGGESGLECADQLVQRHGHLYRLRLSHPLPRMLLAQGEEAAGSHLSAVSAARLAMEVLSMLEQAAEADSQPHGRQLVERAISLAQEHGTEPFKVGDLAGRLGVTREHLSRLFAEELGMSPHQYLQRQRMLAACLLLRRPELSVKEIAVRLGFPGTPQFSRAFRRVVQLSPSEFRASGALPLF